MGGSKLIMGLMAFKVIILLADNRKQTSTLLSSRHIKVIWVVTEDNVYCGPQSHLYSLIEWELDCFVRLYLQRHPIQSPTISGLFDKDSMRFNPDDSAV